MSTLTILSHNVFWFQGVPFLTDKPPEAHSEVLSRLCAIYQQGKPDVICLQEIQSQETFERIATHLGMNGCYCPGTMLRQYGGATLWRSGHGALVRDSQSALVPTQRMWQIVEIKGGDCGLRIGNVHLPSSRHLGREGAQAQRIAELNDLISCRETQPDVIVGDFNEQPAGPLGESLQGQAYVDTAVSTACTALSTNLGGGRGDYIWIRKQIEARLKTYGVAAQQELACQAMGKDFLSDHLPLWITLACAT